MFASEGGEAGGVDDAVSLDRCRGLTHVKGMRRREVGKKKKNSILTRLILWHAVGVMSVRERKAARELTNE